MTPPPSSLFDAASLTSHIGRRILLRGQFVGPVMLDGVEDLGSTVSLRVRLPDGGLRETVLDVEELNDGTSYEVLGEAMNLVNGDSLFDLVEAQRIEHAYAHDPNFAVSMSGVRGLPHQIEAVYRHMLPQPRLRFVLADDPGAGKTIMAGLLIKELIARRDLAKLALHLRRERRPSACEGTVRSTQAACLPRPLRRRRGVTAGGAAAGP